MGRKRKHNLDLDTNLCKASFLRPKGLPPQLQSRKRLTPQILFRIGRMKKNTDKNHVIQWKHPLSTLDGLDGVFNPSWGGLSEY